MSPALVMFPDGSVIVIVSLIGHSWCGKHHYQGKRREEGKGHRFGFVTLDMLYHIAPYITTHLAINLVVACEHVHMA